jgi:hypothetical protein
MLSSLKLIFGLSILACLVACSNSAKRQVASESKPALWSRDDERLRTGDLTIWKLQEMAKAKQFDELNSLFNNGLSMNSLPVGYAAGSAGRVLGIDLKYIEIKSFGEALDSLTGKNWRGKYFYQNPNSPYESQGLNRMRETLFSSTAPFVLMSAFKTQLLNGHPLVPEAKSNVVILNYANPRTKPYMQENILSHIQVYDVMVAVPGKFGPLYIGKTWLGKYEKAGEFHAYNKDHLVAWFFLDFNVEALMEQSLNHWDNSKKILFDSTKTNQF